VAVATPPAGSPPQAVPPAPRGRRWRRWAVAGAFLAPAAVLLGVWIIYPTIYTAVRSFYDRTGDAFIGFDNYETLFTDDTLLTAIRNNAIWVAVVPALVTAIGLIFAVLTERVRWATAFKVAVFMPMAISLFASGVIWRLMDQKDPTIGTVNAVIAPVYDEVRPPGALAGAQASGGGGLTGSPGEGLQLARPVPDGGVALLGLSGLAPEDVPEGARQAVRPPPRPEAVSGVVWRDFRPGGGVPGRVEPGELGLPGVQVEVRNADGDGVGSATTGPNGTFIVEGVPQGTYRVAIAASSFRAPFGGVDWLGATLINISVMVAYIWVWAGFAMVVIAAGLSALPRDVLEAARTDGASEWQVFRRVTVPLLAPVLSVVFITMIINVLKVFDIVLSVAPPSVQDDANVIALAMWRTSFGGVNDFGLGSAIAVFLFLLVIPVLLLNIRNFRREA
jgi:alpha-glucoside transport system permease protein